jgi:hypothetical protein
MSRSLGAVYETSVADVDLPGVDVFEAGEHPQRGRLPRARRPDEHHELTVCDIEAEGVDRRDRVARIEARRVDEAHRRH